MDDRLDAWRERPLHVVRHATSENRGWHGFNAEIVEVSGVATEPIVLNDYTVTMLVGSPLRTSMSCGGVSESRLQYPGTFDVFPAQSAISFLDAGSSLFVRVGLDPELVRETAQHMGIDVDRVAIAPRLTCRDAKIEHLMWALKSELEGEQPGGRIFAESLAVALSSQVLRRLEDAHVNRLRSGLSQAELERVLGYVEEHLAFDLSLDDIAHVAGLGPSQLCALFRRSVGTTVHRYVVRRRVERAIELITHSRLPFSDIALQVGFANQSHMTLAMRRLTGTTPKRLRQR